MIPARLVPFLFAAATSGVMSFIVSGIATWKVGGFVVGFFGLWMGAWCTAWVLACPILLFVGPIVRRFLVRHSS